MTTLTIWTVYRNSRDFPRHIVVRPFVATPDNETYFHRCCCVYNSLDEARADLEAMDLLNIGRYPEDEPQIVESWI